MKKIFLFISICVFSFTAHAQLGALLASPGATPGTALLSLPNITANASTEFRWFKSTDGINYSQILGQSAQTLTVSTNVAAIYYCDTFRRQAEIYDLSGYIKIDQTTNPSGFNIRPFVEDVATSFNYMTSFAAAGSERSFVRNSADIPSGSDGGYSDFTAYDTCAANAGDSVEINFTDQCYFESDNQMHHYVWVDWNNDGFFNESNEKVRDTIIPNLEFVYGDLVSSFNFQIPNGTSRGNHKMRVADFNTQLTYQLSPLLETIPTVIREWTASGFPTKTKAEYDLLYSLDIPFSRSSGINFQDYNLFVNATAKIISHTDLTACSNTGSISFSYDGPASSPGYPKFYAVNLWDGSTTQVTPTLNAGVYKISNAPSGRYFIKIEYEPNKYVNTDEVIVALARVLMVNVTAPPITINGGTTTVTVTATGGTPPYTGTGNFVVSAGFYIYTVTDSNGCSALKTISISQPDVLVAASSSTVINCNGGTSTVTVSATGGITPYTGTGSFVVSAGTYSYIVRDAGGATSSTSVTVSQPAPLVVSATAPAITVNGGTTTVTVTATGGTSPYTGTGTFLVGAGTYNYTVTDSKGCTATKSITITQPVALVASASATTINCNGGTSTVTVTAAGGTLPYTGTGSFVVNAGTYNYTVRDAAGATSSTSITVTQPTALVVNATAPPITINGATTTVTVTATGGTSPYTGTGSFVVNAGTYNYTITDSKGCTATKSITITQPALLVASASATTINCNGGTSTVTVTATGGTLPYTGTGSFLVNAGTFNYTVRDAAGATSSTSVTVSQPAAFSGAETFTNVLCNGGSTGSISLAGIAGGTIPYRFAWTGPNSFTGNTVAINNLAIGTYSCTLTDANGCVKNISRTITQPTLIIVSETHTPIKCNNGTSDTVRIIATGGVRPYTYNWGSGFVPDSFQRNIPYNFSNTVVVKDNNGCLMNAPAITFFNPPIINIATTTVPLRCNGDLSGAINASVTGGKPPYLYQWNNTSGILTGATATNLTGVAAGSYSITVKDSLGCIVNSPFITVSQPSALQLTTRIKPVTCFGGNDGGIKAIGSNGTPPYTFNWNTTGVSTDSIGNLVSGNYFLRLLDAAGCFKDARLIVTSPSQIQIAGNITNPSCQTNCDGAITLTSPISTPANPITYAWSNGSNTKDISSVCVGQDTVTVRDTRGCSEKKVFVLFGLAPPPQAVNLGPDKTLCFNQFYVGNASILLPNNTNPYRWFGPNGFTSSAPTISVNQSGTYRVEVRDRFGCIVKDTVNITTSTSKISSEFIAPTQAFKGSKVTLLNISSPTPENTQWILPDTTAGLISVLSQTSLKCELRFNGTGRYKIKLRANTGQCDSVFAKAINVIDSTAFGSSSGYIQDPLVKQFSVAPNPNSGIFYVNIKLLSTSRVKLRLINILTNQIADSRELDLLGNWPYSLMYLINTNIYGPGVYALILETPVINRVMKVVIN